MMVLDTNILSELMKANPAVAVLQWLDQQPINDLTVTAVTVAEILYGIGRLPAGKRQADLFTAAHKLFTEYFANRILPFDALAAGHYAELVCLRQRLGQPIAMADAQIAAICRHHQGKLATRNTKDFAGLDIALINPWLTS